MANLIQTLQRETYTMSPQEIQGQVDLKRTHFSESTEQHL